MKCSEVMTQDPVCCVASDTVSTVAQLMGREDVGSIPVIEKQEGKKLIGIVTDRDLALKVVGENRSPQNTRVYAVMTRDLITCRPDDDLSQTLAAMSQHQIRRVPVVDAEGQVVGIIAQADVALRADNEHKTAEVVEDISKPNPEVQGLTS
jgi:CBS domain-containing protein